MNTLLEAHLLVAISIAALAGLAFVVAGIRNPLVFFYSGVFGTAILKSPELPIVRDKVSVVEVCLLLLWTTWPLFAKGRIRSIMMPYVYGLGGVFCLVCLSSSLLAITTAPPALQSAKMTAYSVLEAVNYCYGVAIVWTTLMVLDTWQRWLGALVSWIGGVAVASFVGVAAIVGLAPGWAVEETGRICSTLRNENQIPSMILPLLLVCFLFVVRRGIAVHFRIAMLTITTASLFTAIGTGSRTAALMIVVAGLSVYWVIGNGEKAKHAVHVVVLANLAVLLSVGIVFYFCFAWSQYDGNYSLMKTPSWQRPAVLLIEWAQGSRAIDGHRPQQIFHAMEYFYQSPILGTGPKFGAVYAETGGEVHNTYFSLLLETGIFGGVAFFALIGLAFVQGWRYSEQCPYPWFAVLAKCLLVGLLLLCLYNSTMLGLRQRNIWFLLGIIYAFCDLVSSGAEPSRLMPGWIPRRKDALFRCPRFTGAPNHDPWPFPRGRDSIK